MTVLRRRFPLLGSAILLVALCAAIGIAASEALAAQPSELRVLFAPDRSDTPESVQLNPAIETPASLSRATGTKAVMTQTHSAGSALRASRAAEYEVMIAPPHIIANALRNGYTLVASTGQRRAYALVASNAIADVSQLGTKRIYLPQRESIHGLVAKSLLFDAGVRLEYAPNVRYGDTTSAGLVAVALGMADATLVDVEMAQDWIAKNPGKGHVLKVSRTMPAGMGIAVRNDVCPLECPRLSAWVQSADASIPGVGRFQLGQRDTAGEYAALASLTDTQTDTQADILSAKLGAKASARNAKN